MDDLISRHAAIDALLVSRGLSDAFNLISRLRPAHPEHKRGNWKPIEYRVDAWDIEGVETWARKYECSECGFIHVVIEDNGRYEYCPRCGTDMRNKEDE